MKHALAGLIYTLTHNSKFLIHLVISVTVLSFGLLLNLSSGEWLMVVAIITVGLMMELINTAIESVVDLVTQEWRQSAKLAKDASAAAVLVYAVGASIIGLMIFVPKLMIYLGQLG